MINRSDLEMARLALAKVTRTEIRLKYALLADVELNEVLPRRLLDFDKQVQNGVIGTLELKLIASQVE